MGPLRAPSHLSLERCSSSGQGWPSLHRSVAAQAHNRGRRRSHRYLGIRSAPPAENGTIPSSAPTSNAGSLVHRLKANAGADDRTGSCRQSANSTGRVPYASLTEAQRNQADEAAQRLLRALQLNGEHSTVTHLVTGCASTALAHSQTATGHAVPGSITHIDMAAAAELLPPLMWQWLSVADLDGWVDRGVAHLLRETLLVQRAAMDASASINELVGWCLDNCSSPAAALAAVWGQQQGQALPPRCRSFYSLLLQRLGLSQSHLPPQKRTPAATQVTDGLGASPHGWQPAVVLCGSVTRTALSTSSRSRSSGELEEEGEAAADDDEAAGPNGGSRSSVGRPKNGRAAAGTRAAPKADAMGNSELVGDPDLLILGELPAEARALLEGGPEIDAAGLDTAQRPEQLQGKPSRSGRGVNGTGRRDAVGAVNGAAGHANGGDVEREALPTGLNGSGGGAETETVTPPDESGWSMNGSRAEEDVQQENRAAAARDTAGVAAGVPANTVASRPTAALLQRPSRSPMSVEPELDDPGQEAGYATSGVSASGSSNLGWLFRGSPAGMQQPYTPVRLIATGRFPLTDVSSGAVLADGLLVPETGPVVISNDPRVFAGTEAVLADYATPAGEKLAIRLEYVVDRSSYHEVSLQLFNISRVVRKRTRNCLMYVNGEAVNVGDPGVSLVPGDEIWFGSRAFSFRVESLQAPPSAVREALQRLCGDVAGTGTGGAGPQDMAGGAMDQSGPGAASSSAAAVTTAGFASDGETSSDELQLSPSTSSGSDMAELSNLSRRDPLRAEAALRRLAAANPGDAAVWLIWAQTAARFEGPGGQAKARLLFRAAVEAARQMEVIPPQPAALQAAAQRAVMRGRGGAVRPSPTGSAGASRDDGAAVDGSVGQPGFVTGLEPQRHNWLLVQALGNWGKHEWRLRMYGSARHLFRASVDEAARHPGGVAGGGGAAILHFWASRELDALNVRNARIIAAEALRKCPADVALYVLAAGVELEGGNLELAKSYCQRAYSLDRTDKQLFLIWPRVEAALGDRLKARLLYERALDMYPLNTKIINLYARFEAEEGSYREAAELYDRALSIDPLSPVMGVHNRADWASLEADLGNMGLARQLLEGGLAAHPRSAPLLVTLAKVERLEGRYAEALRLVRAAQALAGAFNAPVMTERSLVLRALGEREMAANLARHVAAVKELNRMKQQGYWGSEAWRAFIEATRSTEQQALVAAARERKLQLGWAPSVRGAKPQPTGEAGDGRRPAAPEAQQWVQMEQLRLRRAEARRLAMQRAAQVRALEEGGAAAGALGGSTSSGDDEYDEEPVGMPSLNSVRRPMPADEDM